MNQEDRETLHETYGFVKLIAWALAAGLFMWIIRGMSQSNRHEELMERLERIQATCSCDDTTPLCDIDE